MKSFAKRFQAQEDFHAYNIVAGISESVNEVRSWGGLGIGEGGECEIN